MPENVLSHRSRSRSRNLATVAEELARGAATLLGMKDLLSAETLGRDMIRSLVRSNADDFAALDAHAYDVARALGSLATAIWPDCPRANAVKHTGDGSPTRDPDAVVLGASYVLGEINRQTNSLMATRRDEPDMNRVSAMRKQLRIDFAAIESALDALFPATAEPAENAEPEDISPDAVREALMLNGLYGRFGTPSTKTIAAWTAEERKTVHKWAWKGHQSRTVEATIRAPDEAITRSLVPLPIVRSMVADKMSCARTSLSKDRYFFEDTSAVWEIKGGLWKARWADGTPVGNPENNVLFFNSALDAAIALWRGGEGPGASLAERNHS